LQEKNLHQPGWGSNESCVSIVWVVLKNVRPIIMKKSNSSPNQIAPEPVINGIDKLRTVRGQSGSVRDVMASDLTLDQLKQALLDPAVYVVDDTPSMAVRPAERKTADWKKKRFSKR
jgi:hypothetical protein